MTEADKNFIDTCKEILEHGYSSEGTGVRTRWEDGTEANYYSIVGVQNKYDLEKEFPMITIRNNTKTCAGEDGTIVKDYGYQLSKKYDFQTKYGLKLMDQVDYVLYLLKNDSSSRRIMTNLFNHEELKDMNLEPCAFGTQWLVKERKTTFNFKSAFSRYACCEWLEHNAICSTFAYVCKGKWLKSRNSYS